MRLKQHELTRSSMQGGGRFSHRRPPFAMRGSLLITAALAVSLAACTREAQVAPSTTVKETAQKIATVSETVPTEGETLNAEQLFAKVSGSVVLVLNPQESSLGSGVEIDEHLFVTNCHVLAGGQRYFIRRKNKEVAARLVAGDVDRDVCLLNADDGQSQPVATRSASTVRVGENVYAIGNPQGLEQTLSQGIVSALRQNGQGKELPYIQTTAAISQGSSGGGLFDSQGRLIGIPSFMSAEGQNLNFAAPIDWALEISARKTRNYTARTPRANSVQPASPFEEDLGAEAAVNTPIDSAEQLDAHARELLRTGQARRALPLLLQAVALEPDNPQYLTDLGHAYLRLGQTRDALDALGASLNIDDENGFTWLLMGEALSYAGDPELARVSVLHAISHSDDQQAVVAVLSKIPGNSRIPTPWRAVVASALREVSVGAPSF